MALCTLLPVYWSFCFDARALTATCGVPLGKQNFFASHSKLCGQAFRSPSFICACTTAHVNGIELARVTRGEDTAGKRSVSDLRDLQTDAILVSEHIASGKQNNKHRDRFGLHCDSLPLLWQSSGRKEKSLKRGQQQGCEWSNTNLYEKLSKTGISVNLIILS